MNLGRTILGAVVGVAVAIAVYLGVRFGLKIQATWFPIVTGVIVGFFVRKFDGSTTSYVRGALAGLVAAAAVFGSEVAAREYLTRVKPTLKQTEVVKKDKKDDEAAGDGEEAEEEIAAEGPPTIKSGEENKPANLMDEIGNAKAIKKDDTLPFVFMVVGIFLAYELARGSGPKNVAEATDAPDDSESGDSEEG